MRTVSITEIIRRYGLSSKRLSPKNRIKYTDAVKGITKYESADYTLDGVIDNKLEPNHSISCNCQIPGCNMRIRYEYVLKDKKSGNKVVAGSTCVWPTLGMSELEKKEFLSYDKAIKEHSDLLEWEKANPDVVAKLDRLKGLSLHQYRPYWEEIEYSRLMDEDTEYIRNLDVDEIVRRLEEAKRVKEERRRKEEEYRKASDEEKKRLDDEYNRVLQGLDSLIENNPDSAFYKSLKSQVRYGRKLTEKQCDCVKRGVNQLWYDTKIKGTSSDVMKSCVSVVHAELSNLKVSFDFSNKDDIRKATSLFDRMDPAKRMAWRLYRVKMGLVV